jgi:polysaccharide export outer membrane protein
MTTRFRLFSVLVLTLSCVNLLEEKYSVIYKEPFILLNVTNRRAFVFIGRGNAQVIALPTENTTLIEVIALAGGLTGDSKSHKVRVIRGNYDNPMIKKVNLSTISGLKDADMIIQPYDLIVVEPTTEIAPQLLRQITPILTLATTLTTIILLVRR